MYIYSLTWMTKDVSFSPLSTDCTAEAGYVQSCEDTSSTDLVNTRVLLEKFKNNKRSEEKINDLTTTRAEKSEPDRRRDFNKDLDFGSSGSADAAAGDGVNNMLNDSKIRSTSNLSSVCNTIFLTIAVMNPSGSR